MAKCKKCWGTGQVLDHAALGREAKAWREMAGLSPTQAAARMGISRTYLFLLERGRRRWSESLWKKLGIPLEQGITGMYD